MGCRASRQKMLSLSTLMRSTSTMTKWMNQTLLRMSHQSNSRHSICHTSWTAIPSQDLTATTTIVPYPSSNKLKARVKVTKTSVVSTRKGNTILSSQTLTCSQILCKEMDLKTRICIKSSFRHSKSSLMRVLSMEAIHKPPVGSSAVGEWQDYRVHLGEA